MASRTLALLALLAALLAAPARPAGGGEPVAGGAVFTVATYTVRPGGIDRFLELREKAQPMVRQNEYILSRQVLRHAWGPAWSVMVVTGYARLADLEKARARTRELYRQAYSEEQRRAWNAEYHALLLGHSDAIVEAVPPLGK